MAQRKLLEIRDLQTHFSTEEGKVKAVDGISFTLYRGDTLGIVGESGSGKSVSSLSILRLIQSPPGEIVSGQILYYPPDSDQAIDLLQISEEAIRQYRGNDLAMIFQEPMTSLNPVFTCGDQVIESILLHLKVDKTQAKQQVLQLFEKVKLPDPERIYRSYPHQLSGGQKQRVMIAMAMSCNPQILIADEPTTALDVTVQKAILELMAEIKTELDTAIIFITHDLGVVAEIADQVLVMYQGKIVEQGTVADIFLQPKHAYTKSLLACRPPLDRKLRRLPVVSDFMEWQKDAEGSRQMKEKETTVEAMLKSYEWSAEAIAARKQKIYAQEPLLRVEKLSTWFPKKKNFFGQTTAYLKAVDEVSFEIYPGETLGLVGESGCGKTTLGRSILRLSEAKSGRVFYKDQDLLAFSARQLKEIRKEIQIIFQDPYSSLNPRMTVGQAIQEPLLVHGLFPNAKACRDRVIDLLETVNLGAEHYSRYPHEFSGGQRQRICIARALALEPQFIICDESVSALDVSVQAQVLNLLLELREKYQLTYIFISHDLSVVKFMSDRMMVMNEGQIEEIGLPDEIYQNPKKAYTQRLINAIPHGKVVKSS